jgi:bifunctional UDP-N-acetylglucosamine pyrophosphorylase/glucosamine-1-phosphate N-acetyltransferase
MIAIILAAGRGTRMGSLTDNTPKPMLLVKGKNLLERKLEILPKEVTKVIFVVGYLKEKIKEYFGSNWNGIDILYVEQQTMSGTAGAIALCEDHLRNEETFLVLMGDDLYAKEDLEMLALYPYAMLISNEGEEARKKGWQVFFDQNNLLTAVHQHVIPEKTSTYINAGAYSLGTEYFTAPMYQMDNGEFSLPNTLLNLIEQKEQDGVPFPVHVVEATSWIQITAPESISEAEKLL